jgi:dTDP-4-dehydrorhamnose reductase
MSILVVSPDGMLGRAFAERLAARGDAFASRTFPSLDLRDPASLARALDETRPTVVINCAAYTDVDGAETSEPLATEVNGVGVGRLARACVERGVRLVHFGTDYVFAGEASSPYAVDAPVAPRTAYGRSKALGERELAASGVRHLYLRTSWLYAPWGKNFVRTIATVAEHKDVLRVVDDQRGRPTSAEGLVTTTLALLERGAEGTFHAADDGECTWFELASFVVHERGARVRLEPCTTAEFPRPAPRPRYSVLDLSRTHALVPPAPHWKVSVADAIRRFDPPIPRRDESAGQ